MLSPDYRVELDVFTGPQDLLLYLVRRNELDIVDLPVSTVTTQFQEFLTILQVIDLDLVGDFVVMASTLMEIKSRMVLPSEEEEAVEEGPSVDGDPRSDLVRQLLEVQRLLIQCQPALLDDAVTANSLLTMFGALLPESAAWFGSLMVAHAELGSSRPFLEALLVDEEVRAEALSAEERQILQKLKGARAKLREVLRVLAEPAAGQAGGGGGAATSPCTS